MPKASEIKKNQAVEYEGRVYFVKDIERTPFRYVNPFGGNARFVVVIKTCSISDQINRRDRKRSVYAACDRMSLPC